MFDFLEGTERHFTRISKEGDKNEYRKKKAFVKYVVISICWFTDLIEPATHVGIKTALYLL